MCVYVNACACACAPVCALRLWGRELRAKSFDMSFRGIRHLKREEVKATQLGIKHQPTSAPSSAKLMKTSARSSLRTSPIYMISFGFIIWHYRVQPVYPGRLISFLHLKWFNRRHYTGINWYPESDWVSAFTFMFGCDFIRFYNCSGTRLFLKMRQDFCAS